ncbi:hypothetical protein B0H65DRAFT_439490 [Neurospora tetraspora]|uniref:Uncharacterized protein n=1 Tax=Neurospora tetraspora TaxID=94610 RepID=A0AAE0JJE7_9PEZI|nr:hypothetical protein B0H65DRAFT_439490 [Neurospora tetraspora]
MNEAILPAPAKSSGESGNMGVMKYPPLQKRKKAELHTSEIEPWIRVLIDNMDTALYPASTEMVARNSGWDEPGNLRGVIMYLPPKGMIRRKLRTQIKNMDDRVFGHPVVILFMRRTEGTETVRIFPVSRFRFFLGSRHWHYHVIHSLEPASLVRLPMLTVGCPSDYQFPRAL